MVNQTVSDSDVNDWQNEVIARVIKNYAPCDIFKADGGGLFLQLMADKAYVFKGEKHYGGK